MSVVVLPSISPLAAVFDSAPFFLSASESVNSVILHTQMRQKNASPRNGVSLLAAAAEIWTSFIIIMHTKLDKLTVLQLTADYSGKLIKLTSK